MKPKNQKDKNCSKIWDGLVRIIDKTVEVLEIQRRINIRTNKAINALIFWCLFLSLLTVMNLIIGVCLVWK